MQIVLPWPPTVNLLYGFNVMHRRGGGGHFVKPYMKPEGKKYKEYAFLVARAAGAELIEGPVEMIIELHPPDKRKRDMDNLLKILQDSFNGVAYDDDYQIADLRVLRRGVIKGGRVIVTTNPMEPEDNLFTEEK